MSAIIKIGRDEASGAVADVHRKLTSPDQRRALMKNIGVRAEGELKNWFYKRDAESPNKMGWPRKHFWARIRQATAFDPSKTTESTATVNVADPALSPKIADHDTTIRPRPPHRALTIPMNAEAYEAGSPGNPASSKIPGMFVFRSTHTNGAFLVKKEGAGKVANLTFYYRLVPSVTVHPDPKALPPAAELGPKLGETAQAFYLRSGPSSGGKN
jgi:hypothetical protein